MIADRISYFITLVLITISQSESCVQKCKDGLEHQKTIRDTVQVYVADYGIVGDSLTDNTVALLHMVSSLVAQPEKYWDIQFSPGQYLYYDNTWPIGLTYFRISGNGSAFQNITPTAIQGEDCQPISMRGPHRKPNAIHRYDYDSGARFRQLSSGYIQIIDTKKSFDCGDLVLLSGYEQQHEGYPPNPRYFEYKMITGMNRKGMVLAFDAPLQFVYDAEWGDYVWGAPGRELRSGAPRILNLSNAGYTFPRHIEIRDVTFLPNPNCTISNALVIPGEVVIYRNVHVENIYPAYHRKVMYIGGSVDRLVEFDKITDTIHFEGVYIRRWNSEPNPSPANGATGVHHLHILNCTIEGPLRVSPRNLVVQNTRFILTERDAGVAAIERYNDFFPVRSIFIDSIEIINHTGAQNSIVGYDNINTLTLTSPVDVNDCIPVPDDDIHKVLVLMSVDIGTTVHSPEHNVNGTVTRMHKDPNGHWCLNIHWERTISGYLQQIQWSQVKEIAISHSTSSPQVSVFSAGRAQRAHLLEQLQKVALHATAHDD